LNTDNPDLCEKITDSYTKNECYESIAIKTRNSTLCEESPTPDKCYERYQTFVK
jgi:hypothetical protein